MSEIDLDAIRARVDAATEGPWEVAGFGFVDPASGDGEDWIDVRSPLGIVTGCVFTGDDRTDDQTEADHGFIAHARTDVPALLAEVDRERERADRLEAMCDRLAGDRVDREDAAEARAETAEAERDALNDMIRAQSRAAEHAYPYCLRCGRDAKAKAWDEGDAAREALARAWDEGFKQGGPMCDVDYDDPDAHTRNPYCVDLAQPATDEGADQCLHEAWEVDAAGRRGRCADCRVWLGAMDEGAGA